jgi:hypothetical protein
MAEHADEWMEGMQDRFTLQAMMGFYGREAQVQALGFDTTPNKMSEEEKEKLRQKARDRYAINKVAKVGEHLTCPSCNKDFTKKSYQQAFCQRLKSLKGSACKDVYWNTTDPTRRARANLYKK